MNEETIFTEAIRLADPAERAAFLESACGQNEPLRRRVEALLAAHDPGGSFLAPLVDPPTTVAPPGVHLSTVAQGSSDRTAADDPPETQADTLAAHETPGAQTATVRQTEPGRSRMPLPEEDATGAVFGPYKLVQPIGEGGMGTVYLAEQSRPVRRLVALKVIKPGMDSRQVLARFEAERQALALMDHPNIARVLDAGATDRGRPYFVMELVKGQPITQYCDEKRLTPRERLELFIPVCQAVQHAHQKGVIHRDLKPSNVLVGVYDGRPVPKVIDFGVAKATGQRLTEATLFTGFGAVVGTPEYMSPEQAQLDNVDIDTRSDVYSLGVLLYELLTGTTPLDLKRLREAALLEVLRVIREEEPPRPSTRLSTTQELPSIAACRGVEPARITRLMRGELDWIVMKSLEKDRNRRYETANGLALDIQRYLANEDVEACPPSIAYRFRKLAYRNRGLLTTGAIVLLALVVGTVVATWEAVRAVKSESLAEERLETANRNYQEAERQRKAARDQESIANQQRQIAIANEGAARKHELFARRSSYASQMNLAQKAWEEGKPARVLQLLENQRPKLGDIDLRGFEWYHLWQLCQGRRRFSLPIKNIDNAKALAFSPDGKTLASGYGKWVKVWDAASGREIRQLGPHTGAIGFVAYAPDGKTLVSNDGRIRIWDLLVDKEPRILNAVYGGSAFVADGKTLVTGGDRVSIWDFVQGREVEKLPDSNGEFEFVAVAPDGKTVAAGGQGEVRIWTRDGTSWRGHAPISQHGWRPPVAISPDGKTMAVGYELLALYDLETRKSRHLLQGHIGTAFVVAFSRDGKKLVSAGQDRTVRVWDVGSGKQLDCFAHHEPVNAVALSPDCNTVAGMTSQSIEVWDTGAVEEQVVLRHSSGDQSNYIGAERLTRGVASVAFSPDGGVLSSGGGGVVNHWDPISGRHISVTSVEGAGRTCLVYTPEGNGLFLSGLPNNVIRVTKPAQGTVATFTGHGSEVTDLAASRNGKTVSSVDRTGSVIVWDLQAHQPRHSIPMGGWLTSVAVSPDGQLVAAGGQFGIVKLFDADTGQERAILQRFELAVTYTWSLAFSPDGRLLASGDREGVIRLWDLAAGRLHASLRGHVDSVWSLSFSPDGLTLASASADHTVRLWDVSTGEERITLKGPGGGVTSVAFSPGGKVLAAGGRDGTVRLWHAASNQDARSRQKELDPSVPNTPAALNEIGDRLWQSGRVDEAEKAYRDALARLQQLAKSSPGEPAYLMEKIRSLLSLDGLLEERQRPQEAENVRRQALALNEQLSAEQKHALNFTYGERVRKLHASGPVQAARTLHAYARLDPKRALLWARLVAISSELGDERKVIEGYSRLIELEPKNALAHNNLAWLVVKAPGASAGDLERAVELASQAVALEPKEGGYWNTLGVACYRAGDWKRAIESLERSVELGRGGSCHDWLFLAMAHERLGAGEAARKWLDKAIAWVDASKPKDQELLGFVDEALERLSGMITRESGPESTAALIEDLRRRARLLAARGKPDRGAVDLNRAIFLAPQDHALRRERALLLERLGRWDEAIASYTEVIEKDPAQPWPWHVRGDFYNRRRDYGKAIADFTRAIELEPAVWYHYYPRGDARAELKDLEGALLDYRKVIELHPGKESLHNLAWAWHHTGDIRREQGRPDEAVTAYVKAIEIDPTDPWHRYSVALIHPDPKEWKQIVETCTKAIELKGDDPGFHEVRGHARRELGDWEGSIADFTRAIELKPEEWGYPMWRGVAYRVRREADKAVADFTRVLELHPAANEWVARELVELSPVPGIEKPLRLALNGLKKPSAGEAPNPELDHVRVMATGLLARVLNGSGRPDEAEALGREAVNAWEALIKAFPTEPAYPSSLAGFIHNMTPPGETPDAECRRFERAVRLGELAVTLATDGRGHQVHLANHYWALARAMVRAERLPEARAMYLKTLELKRKNASDFLEVTSLLSDAAEIEKEIARLDESAPKE